MMLYEKHAFHNAAAMGPAQPEQQETATAAAQAQ